MHTTTMHYREPAYVSIARKYATHQKAKKRIFVLKRFGWRRMSAKGGSASGGKKLLRRYIFKSLNKQFYARSYS